MSNLALYSDARVYVVGTGTLTEESSVSIDQNPGLNMVFTTVNGLSGASQGAATTEVTIDNAVPSADFELNPDKFISISGVVELWITMAGRTAKFKGFLTGATFSHSVNDASKLTIKFTCRYAAFE